mmetsp:Transcript_15100/g.39228  ORF Transcript_15100/g.39228 Transcript_15100/m.39228 type:complete len:595 (-) Transcript_15100:278-2062(-)
MTIMPSACRRGALAMVALAMAASGRQIAPTVRRPELQQQHMPSLRAPLQTRLRTSDLALRTRGGSSGSSSPATSKVGLIPVHRKEMPMFLTFAAMMFFTIFIFTMVRDTKDTLVVTTAGAEAIAFLKVYFVIPASMLFFLLYAKMSSILSKRALFVSTMLPFIAFYTLFGFVLYPLRETIHFSSIPSVPQGLTYAVKLFQYWSFTLYYIVSELFGSVGVPLLFWQTANDIVGVEQAKRWYPLFALFGNAGPIVAGQTSALINRRYEYGTALRILTILVAGAGFAVIGTFGAVQRLHALAVREKEQAAAAEQPLPLEPAGAPPVPAPAGGATEAAPVVKKKKPKLSTMQSLAVLARSQYLGLVCALVLSYGLAIEFTEIMWKAVIKMYFPDKSDYMKFMGQYSTAIGVTTFLMTLVGGRIPKIFGWRAGALATPLVIGSLSWLFYAYITFGDVTHSRETLKMAVIVGTTQNVLSKGVKYALFDPTKEMAYIPLDEDSKLKGKAAIDVLGARIGKSGGALIQQAIVMFTGSILAGAPVIAALFSGVIFAWVYSVNKLNVLFKAKLREHEQEQQSAAPAAPAPAGIPPASAPAPPSS